MLEARIEIELDDGGLDALVFCPDTPGRRPPILLLHGSESPPDAAESWSRRLSAHNYFVLKPDLSNLSAEDRREAAWACLDHLADARQVDDTRVGVLGFGRGANLAIALAASRAERVAAVAAYGARSFGTRTALEISQKINGLIRLGYEIGAAPKRAGVLEAALSLSGVLFDTETYERQPDWPGLLDFFSRALNPTLLKDGRSATVAHGGLNP